MGPSLHLWILHAKQRLLDQNYKSLWIPALICGFCMQNSDFWIRITSLYVPALICGFCMQNSDFRTRITSLYRSQTSPMVFYIQNGDFSSRIASLYGSQPSSVVLCIHNSDIMTRINSLYGSQTSPVNLSMQNNVINIRITRVYGSQPSSVDFVCKTASFGPELQASMGPSPHLWFMHAKQRLLDQNYKSLWVPALICGFCMQNSDFSIRITSLYGSQTPPMIFCIQNSDFSCGIASLYGSQTSSEVFECKTTWLASELLVSMGPSPNLWFLHAKQRLKDQN